VSSVRWLSPAEQRAWRAYRRMVLLADAEIARDLARDSGLSMPDYTVLTALSEAAEGRRRLSELAGRMQWSASRVSHHVSRMEQRGLVRRAGCDEDLRGAWVEITDAGWAAIRAAAPDHVASVRTHLIDLLTPEQVDTLAEIGETVARHFGERCPDYGPDYGPDLSSDAGVDPVGAPQP
jgi:DNA-binding MarR family transcriptional regulator